MFVENPEALRKWYRDLQRHEERTARGGLHRLLARIMPRAKMPPQDAVFQNPRYVEFLQFYFKVGTVLGAFQEMGKIYFELMRDAMFGEETRDEMDEAEEREEEEKKERKLRGKDWLKFFICGAKRGKDKEERAEVKSDLKQDTATKKENGEASERKEKVDIFSDARKEARAEEVVEAKLDKTGVEEKNGIAKPVLNVDSTDEIIEELTDKLQDKTRLEQKDEQLLALDGKTDSPEDTEAKEQEKKEAKEEEEEEEDPLKRMCRQLLFNVGDYKETFTSCKAAIDEVVADEMMIVLPDAEVVGLVEGLVGELVNNAINLVPGEGTDEGVVDDIVSALSVPAVLAADGADTTTTATPLAGLETAGTDNALKIGARGDILC